MKLNALIYTPYVQNNDFGYQPKYLGKTSNYRPVQEVPTMETEVESEVQQVQEEPKPFVPEVAPIQEPIPSKFSSVNEFKKVMVSVYEQALKARGFNPAFAKSLAAQDALESSWGRKPSGKYNFGGIKGKGTIRTTKEFINGRYITINDSFRDFKDIYEYANFKIDLLNKPRYNVFAHPVDEFAFWVKKGGYATAPTYTQILNNVIKKFKPGGLITYTPFIGRNDLNSTSFTGNRISRTSRSNTSDFKVTDELESFVQEEVPQELPVALPVETPQFQFKQFVPKRGLEGRYAQFANIYTSAGLPQNELGFWANIAQDESGFTPGIVGRNDKYGVEALGYFQMLTKYNNKPMNIAGTYSGVDSQTFLSNPVIQLKAAQNMKNHIMNMFSTKDLEVARAKGYTDSALVAGAWAGGVGGVRKWLHYGKNSVDVNVKDGKNAKRKWECSVAGRMEALNGYFKKGGVLKFATGGGFEKYVEDNRDHINNIYSRITGWGVGDVGYKDTLMTYRRNAPSQLFASTKDDKTAFSEKHFDNVRRYISDKVDSEKLTDDVLYDIFLDFDKYNIKKLDFKQRQDLIDNVMSTSKKSYLNTLDKHEIFYALEGLYGSSHIKKGMYGMRINSPGDDIHSRTADWVSNMNDYMDVEQQSGASYAQWYANLRNNGGSSNEPLAMGSINGAYYIYPQNRKIPVNDYTVDEPYTVKTALEDNVALPINDSTVGNYFINNKNKFFNEDLYSTYNVRGSYDRNAISNYNGHSDSYYDIVHNRIARVQKEMKAYGFTQEEINRLSIPLAIQSIKETGWWDASNSNNQGGHLDSENNLLSYESPESYWRHHFANLDEKWPEWRKANNIEEYINIINNPELNTTKGAFDKYNLGRRKANKNEVYLYAPKWNNEGRDYWTQDIKPILDRFYGYYYMKK